MTMTTTFALGGLSDGGVFPPADPGVTNLDMAVSGSRFVYATQSGANVHVQIKVRNLPSINIELTGRADPSVTIMTNGSILVTATNGNQIISTLMSSSGEIIRENVVTALGVATDVEVVGLSGVTYELVYSYLDASGNPSVARSRYDSFGSPVGPTAVVGSGVVSNPEIAVLANQLTTVVVYQKVVDNVTSVVASIANAGAAREVVIETQGASKPAVTGTADGGFAVVCVVNGGLQVETYTASGVFKSGYRIPATAFQVPRDPQIAEGAGGALIVSASIFGSGETSRIWIGDGNGFHSTRDIPGLANQEESLAVLPDGTIYLGRTNAGGVTVSGSTYQRRVDGDAANDTWTGDGLRSIVNAGAGNDTLNGGSADEELRGGEGNDIINGGDGDDVLEGAAGADQLNGGAGTDQANYSLSPSAVGIDLLNGTASGGDATGDTLTNIEDLVGSDFNDQLAGDGKNNVIAGYKGNDTLRGRAGDDVLNGGAGDDVLIGGAGADYLNGLDGNDTASFEDLTDGVNVVLGIGRATSSSGIDELVSIENIVGSNFADTIDGDAGDNRLNGLNGNDVMFGGDGIDVLIGGEGNDTLVGNAQIFVEQNDTLNGGNGDDLIYGERADTINGGAGYDSLIAINSYNWTLDLAATSIEYAVMDFGSDYVDGSGQTRAVSVFASGGNDTVVGSAFDDLIFGGVGDDILTGNNGSDALVGDLGADRLDGGAGDDRIYFDAQDALVQGGSGYDAGYITTGTGGGVNINLSTSSLEFLQDLAGLSDIIIGSGQSVGVSVYAGGGGDTVTGSSFDDILWGEAGDDILSGNSGADVLVGGVGQDRLSGGAGVDQLYGGAADGVRDTFVFQHTGQANRDFIYEFEQANDRIDLSGLGANPFSNVSINTSGGNSTVFLNGQIICVVVGVTNLTSANFIFAAAASEEAFAKPDVPLIQPALEDPGLTFLSDAARPLGHPGLEAQHDWLM